MYSLYTINTCSVYCIRSVYMSCHDLRPVNRTQVVCSQKQFDFVLYTNFTARGEFSFQGGGEFSKSKIHCQGGEFRFSGVGANSPLKRDFFPRGGVPRPLEFWALFFLYVTRYIVIGDPSTGKLLPSKHKGHEKIYKQTNTQTSGLGAGTHPSVFAAFTARKRPLNQRTWSVISMSHYIGCETHVSIS